MRRLRARLRDRHPNYGSRLRQSLSGDAWVECDSGIRGGQRESGRAESRARHRGAGVRLAAEPAGKEQQEAGGSRYGAHKSLRSKVMRARSLSAREIRPRARPPLRLRLTRAAVKFCILRVGTRVPISLTVGAGAKA